MGGREGERVGGEEGRGQEGERTLLAPGLAPGSSLPPPPCPSASIIVTFLPDSKKVQLQELLLASHAAPRTRRHSGAGAIIACCVLLSVLDRRELLIAEGVAHACEDILL